MSLDQVRIQTALSHQPPSQKDTHLHGRWLFLTQVGWVTVVVASLGLFFVSLPTYFAHLQSVCIDTACAYQQLTLHNAHALQALGISVGGYAALTLTLTLSIALVFVVTGSMVAWRKSDDWMALLVALLLVVSGEALGIGDFYATSQVGWELPAVLLNTLVSLMVFLVFSLFPSGRFAPRWAGCFVIIFLILTVPHEFFSDRPFILTRWSFFLSGLAFSVSLLSLPLAQMYRYRRVSTPVQRQQTKWILFSFTALIVVLLSGSLLEGIFPSLHGSLYDVANTSVSYLVSLLIPVSFAIAILRYRLWDIDILINRTLVYGALTASVVGLYILVVGYLSGIFHAEGNAFIALVATGVVAVLFQPLRNALQRGVNRFFYGERDNPSLVLRHLGQQLDAVMAPNVILPTIVETIATTLKLPYVAITSAEDVPLASAGTSGSDRLRLPLVYQHETLGYLLVGPRPGEMLSQADRRLLADVARHAGVAMQTVRQAQALQQARERLVLSREEERRRLRRDLHDGLGPTLSALTLKAGSARVLLRHDPDTAEALMREVEADIKATVADIRRLVYALRPPVLDEQGLVMAIRACAEQCALPLVRTHALRIKVDAPESLPPLPAAVELAAYRIVQEAVSNVARHAQARNCTICLLITESLHVEISDDGVGLSADHPMGVGLVSMCERAEELGGKCVVESSAAKGVRVWASLPLSQVQVLETKIFSPDEEEHKR